MTKEELMQLKRRCGSCLAAVIAAILVLGQGCTDPAEYDPTEPLDPPPGPPAIIYPLADTNLCDGEYQNVFFDWTAVAGAEIYEIQTDSSLTFSDAETHQFTQPPQYITLYRYSSTATYYARIRAASTNWSSYTVWSEPRRFYLRPDG